MKIKFEYPWPVWIGSSDEIFKDLIMFDISFRTTIHYLKNHDSGYEYFALCIFGFGFRLERFNK